MKTAHLGLPNKVSALEKLLGAHGNELPPDVLKNALHGKKPKALSDPNDDSLNEIGGSKKAKALKGESC